jgi:hypothetical protein
MIEAQLVDRLCGLRASWPEYWQGVPHAFDQTLQMLRGDADGLSARTACLVEAGRRVAAFVERSGALMAEQGQEPAYHSRLHTSIALVSLGALLSAQRAIDGASETCLTHSEALMLLAMAGHDAAHTGARNAFPGELELRSVATVDPILRACDLDGADIEAVRALILLTEPRHVAGHHQRAKAHAFDVDAPVWQGVFLQEADILASVLPELQADLTALLAREWSDDHADEARELLTAEGRRHFLQYAALFSTPAARALGLNESVKNQLLLILNS